MSTTSSILGFETPKRFQQVLLPELRFAKTNVRTSKDLLGNRGNRVQAAGASRCEQVKADFCWLDMPQDRVRIRVGEKLFFTSRATLANGGRKSLLAAMSDSLWQRPAMGDPFSEAEELFIDRNPSYFGVLLELLRTGELHIPAGMSETALFEEAVYYGLLGQVRAALKCGPLDGNNMVRATSVHGGDCGPGPTMRGLGRAIRASADGGCCVARQRVVRVYDWKLQQQAVVNLDYATVTDMAFMGTQRVLLGTDKGVEDCVFGGMACFDGPSGQLVHRYELRRDEQLTTFSAAAVATDDDDRHAFACCIDVGDKQLQVGILGTWDQSTGQLVRQFQLPPDNQGRMPEYDAGCKLQWLPERKLLLVASATVLSGSCISLLMSDQGKSCGRIAALCGAKAGSWMLWL